jgi:hypothetical protein
VRPNFLSGGVSWFYFASEPSPFAHGRAIVLMKRGSGTSTAAFTALIDSVAVAEKN